LSKAAILMMSRQPEAHLSTIERIELALVALAYFIELDGDVHEGSLPNQIGGYVVARRLVRSSSARPKMSATQCPTILLD
jgi:hypothetical protein